MIRSLLLAVLRLYRRVVSPFYGPVCKYHPSCSAYAVQAVETHGAARGSALAAWRVLRCNPFSDGGYDPVPAPRPTHPSSSVDGRRSHADAAMSDDGHSGRPAVPDGLPGAALSVPAPPTPAAVTTTAAAGEARL